MSKRANRLSHLEIDEVSTVDVDANGYAKFSFSKAGEGPQIQEDSMPEQTFYDDDGDPVDVEDLEQGDVVRDESGAEFVFVEDEIDEHADASGYASVGKALGARAAFIERGAANAAARRKIAPKVANVAGKKSGWALDEAAGQMKREAHGAGSRARQAGAYARGIPASMPGSVGVARAREQLGRGVGRVAAQPGLYGGLAAGGAGLAGGGYTLGRRSNQPAFAKSSGDRLLEDLSKALTDTDRDEVIAKALDQVSALEGSNAEIAKALDDERELRLSNEFFSKALEYNLPIAADDFGPILKSLYTGTPLTDAELADLDEVFKAVGSYLYEEIGSLGDTSNGSVMDEVDQIASQVVAKTGGQLTEEQAFAAALDANPYAYDEYLKENTR